MSETEGAPQVPQERIDEAVECGLSEDEGQVLWYCFRLFDEDNSGSIDEKELRNVMQVADCDVSENAIKKMMEEIDTDGNGTVSFKEFCSMAKRKQKEKNDRMEKLRKAFSTFDTDGSGYVDREELKDGLTAMGKEPLSEEEIDNLMNMVDMDGDGQLSIEEFARVLTMSVQEMVQQNQPPAPM